MDYRDIDKYSQCKPFRNNHFSQLNLIEKLPKIKLNLGQEEIESIVNNFSDDVSRKRVNSMVKSLIKEVKLCKGLYSKI